MNNNSENLQKIQSPALKNVDEMSQQTLDALKVVHLFESKATRSARIQEILRRNEDKRSVRAPLVPIRPSSSPERRFQGSPKVLRPTSESGSRRAAAQIASVHGGYSLMRLRNEEKNSISFTGESKDTSYAKPSSRVYSSVKLEDTSIIKSGSINRRLFKSSLNPRGSAALPATRTKGSSTAFTSSRLLQPTAASVAKVNSRILQQPGSKGILSSKSKNGSFAQSEPNKGVKTQSNAFIPIVPASLKSPSSNSNTTSIFAKSKMPLIRPNAVLSANTLANPKISTPKSKALFEERFTAQSTSNEPRTVNPSLLVLEQNHNTSPKFSTPARAINPIAETSPSMQSIDYSNFSNFSYVAEWARTPELVKQTLAQQQVDTTRLFGAIPPVDIDAIFGAEIKRQQR